MLPNMGQCQDSSRCGPAPAPAASALRPAGMRAANVTVYEVHTNSEPTAARSSISLPVAQRVCHRNHFTASEAVMWMESLWLLLSITGLNSSIIPQHQVLALGLWGVVQSARDVRIEVAYSRAAYSTSNQYA